MTPRAFVANGECEHIKGCVHAASASLMAIMLVYNAMAWVFRRDRHLAINSALYLTGLILEARKATSHFTT